MVLADAKGTIREIVLPKGLDLDRPKRTRTSFTAEQLYRLEMEFQRCQYVVGRERTELARQLNLSETQVRARPGLHHLFLGAGGTLCMRPNIKEPNMTWKEHTHVRGKLRASGKREPIVFTRGLD